MLIYTIMVYTVSAIDLYITQMIIFKKKNMIPP